MTNKWKICPICRGDGTHVNPNIDACGLSSDGFYDDPDFFEDYMSGVYDVRCLTCEGTGKVLASELNIKMKKLQESAAERRLSAMEDGNFEAYCHASDYRYG